MPGLFIDVEIDAKAIDAEIAKKVAEACPVDIFEAKGASLRIVEANLDECTLCDLCLQAAPKGSLRIVKLYE
jgi:NAD-dependent dihydropyrimidine dehydrogenase PreA subunit